MTARRLDVASLALLLVGLICALFSYWLITAHGLNPLILVPSVAAATTGAGHITKRERRTPLEPAQRLVDGGLTVASPREPDRYELDDVAQEFGIDLDEPDDLDRLVRLIDERIARALAGVVTYSRGVR